MTGCKPVLLLLLMTVAALSSTAIAQERQPRKAPQKADGKTFPVKPVIEANLATLDDELAAYLQFRGDVPADGAARLELLIDLRVVARWILLKAVQEKPESELQIAAVLRADELLDTAATLTELFKTMPKPTPQQIDGMARLHTLTFKLPEIKGIGQMDEVCREVGSLLVSAAGPLPPEVRQIPLMRPSLVSRTVIPEPRPQQPAGASADPLARANALTVSPALKKQVINVITLATAAASDADNDAKKSQEAAVLKSVGNRALDLAEGLARGTAVDASSRPQLEQRLADGLALFADARTRSAGQSRLASLDAYAQTISRIRRMNLKPELQQKLMPAFAWAGENPDQGPKMMATIESYLETCARLDARASAPPPQLPPREAKAVADAIKLAQTERDVFLTSAASMGGGRQSDIQTLAGHVDTMKKSIESAETFEQVPKSLQVLLAFKPRPTGALERRFAGLMAALNDPRPSAAKDEAGAAMAEMVRLADLASELDWPAPVSSDVQSLYTRGKLAAFETRRRELVAELASDLAAAKKMDAGKLQRLEQMRELRRALAEAAVFEMAMKKAEPLSRWIDWRVEPAELQAIITPYRDTVASLFETYTTDATPAVTWKLFHERYSPLLRLVIRQLPHGDSCAALPTGLAGHVGRLMTPLESQSFADERYTAYALKIWMRYHETGDEKSATLVADTLAAKLKK